MGFVRVFTPGNLRLIAVLANGRRKMLETIAVVLVLLWLLGFVTSYTMGGLLHDTLTSGPYGLFGFADTIVGYTTARLAQRLVIQRSTGVLALVSFASVAQQAIVVAVHEDEVHVATSAQRRQRALVLA